MLKRVMAVLCLSGVIVSGDSGGVFADPVRLNVVQPMLTVSGADSTNSVSVRWTAPGDDGNVGTASVYDLRFATFAIGEVTWDDATQVIGEPTPQPAGTLETFLVTGLESGVTYFFAIKTADEIPNWSPLSNVVSKRTATMSLRGGAFFPFLGKFDANSSVDLGLYEPATGNWYFALRDVAGQRFTPSPSPWLTGWGTGSGYELIVGDFAGDELDDICVYHAGTGRWFVAVNEGGRLIQANGPGTFGCWLDGWGMGTVGTYVPFVGNFSTDRKSDVGVYHPGTGRWFVAFNQGGRFAQANGTSIYGSWLDGWAIENGHYHWQPLVGDFSGDEVDDICVYSPDLGSWFVRFNQGYQQFGSPGDELWLQGWAKGSPGTYLPFVGRLSVDNHWDVGVYAPYEGRWFVAFNHGTSFAQASGPAIYGSWLDGWASRKDIYDWQYLMGDVSDDGYTDVIVYTPQSGRWFVSFNQSNASFTPTVPVNVWLDAWGIASGIGSSKLAAGTVAADRKELFLRQDPHLNQNAPNPFNPRTTITFTLPEASAVSLTVYNILGRKVATLVDDEREAGTYTVVWDGSVHPSGVYCYRLSTSQGAINRKMSLVK